MKLRQFIYPVKLLSSFVSSNFHDELTKIHKSKNLNPIYLGRARYGIFLAIQEVIRASSKKRILTSPFTILDVLNCISAAGGKPIFYDFANEKTFFPDFKNIENLIKSESFAAIVITHYHFNYTDIDKLLVLCKKYNVKVIEDCAIAYNTSYSDNKHVGSLSDFSIFSNSLFKFSNFLWGGVLHVKDHSKYLKIKRFVDEKPKLSFFDYREIYFKYLKFKFLTNRLIVNFMISPLLKFDAFFNLNFMEKLITNDPYLPYTKKIPKEYEVRPHSAYYYEMYSKLNDVQRYFLHRVSNSKIYFKQLEDYYIHCNFKNFLHGGHINFPILLPSKELKKHLKKRLCLSGYDVAQKLYRNVHTVSGYNSIEGCSDNVKNMIDRVLFLPNHPQITNNDVYKICNIITGEINKLKN